MKAKPASDFSMKRNTIEIVLLLADVYYLDCGPEQVITARRIGRHEIPNDNVAGLYDRLATEYLKQVWEWIVDI